MTAKPTEQHTKLPEFDKSSGGFVDEKEWNWEKERGKIEQFCGQIEQYGRGEL